MDTLEFYYDSVYITKLRLGTASNLLDIFLRWLDMFGQIFFLGQFLYGRIFLGSFFAYGKKADPYVNPLFWIRIGEFFYVKSLHLYILCFVHRFVSSFWPGLNFGLVD